MMVWLNCVEMLPMGYPRGCLLSKQRGMLIASVKLVITRSGCGFDKLPGMSSIHSFKIWRKKDPI